MKEQERYGYVKLSNAFWRNGKTMTLLRMNPTAIAYYTLLLAYCSDNLTDGVIPDIAIRGVFAIPDDVMDLLVEVHLVDKLGESFRIHDYLKWNLSGSEIEQDRIARREKEREKKRKQREQRALAQQKAGESESVPTLSPSCPPDVPSVSRAVPMQLRTKNLELRTNTSFSSKSSSSRFSASRYKPSEKKEKEIQENQKINTNQYTKLLAGFHAWWDEQDELKSQTQWDHLFAGWVAKSKNRPEYQTHTHTWACEHTLHALHASSTGEVTARYEEPTRGVQLAQHVARNLNNGLSEKEAVQQAEEQMFD